ncbi:MAG: hypothetical protein H7Z73_05340 [Candidatus Saccharibacteria bacterium]|nr:hypothetical protein [Moraxellaceae bacterium]
MTQIHHCLNRSEFARYHGWSMMFVSCLMLAACGGGGSSSSSTTTTTTTTTTTITTPPPTTSPPPVSSSCALTAQTGSFAASANARISFYRTLAGLPNLVTDPLLVKSAGNHANYLSLLPTASVRSHTEVAGMPCFTGVAVSDRLAAVGDTDTFAGEDFAQASLISGSDTVDLLFDAVYHRMSFLTNFGKIGVAWQSSTVSPNHLLTINMAGQGTGYGTSQPLVTYPASNQTNVPLDWLVDEIPCPLGCSQTGTLVGYPISIQTGGRNLHVTSFTLTDGSGLVSGTLLTPTTDPNLVGTNDRAAFIPQTHLLSNTTYTAQVIGTLDGAPLTKTWVFTTLTVSPLQLTSSVSTAVPKDGTFDLTFSGGSQNYNPQSGTIFTFSFSATSTSAPQPIDGVIQTANSYRFTNNGKCTISTGCNVNIQGTDSLGNTATTVVFVLP